MCIHESSNSVEYSRIVDSMKRKYGLVALTLHGLREGGADFTVFVNPNIIDVCIQRGAHDLRKWHPHNNGFSERSGTALSNAGNTKFYWAQSINNLAFIEGRGTIDNMDVDDTDVDAVYAACLANGYVTEVQPTASSSAGTVETELPNGSQTLAPGEQAVIYDGPTNAFNSDESVEALLVNLLVSDDATLEADLGAEKVRKLKNHLRRIARSAGL